MKSKARRLADLAISACYCAACRACQAAKALTGNARPGRCTVLCYHAIRADELDRFRRQLDVLLRVAKPVRADERHGLEPRRLHAAVTFDDAYACALETAVPELAARGIPCTVFVPTARLGALPDWAGAVESGDASILIATAEQIRNLSADLVTVGSHSVSHADLALLDPDAVTRELVESRTELERIVGRPVTLFAYPYGREVPTVPERARRAGYERVFSAQPRRASMNEDDYTLGRVRVDPTDWPLEFRLKLFGGYDWIPTLSRAKRRLLGLTNGKTNGKARDDTCATRVEVDEVDSDAWNTLLRQFDDASIYQTWDYEAVRWGDRRMSHLVLREGQRVVAAAQVRVVKAPGLPVGIAYVFRGPLWRLHGEEPDPDRLRRAIRALRDEYATRRRLLLRVLPNVLAEDNREMVSLFEAEGFYRDEGAQKYRTLLMDLSPPIEVLRKGLRHQWRTNLNKADARTFDIVDGTGDDLYGEFLELYREMHDRKRFEQHVDVDSFREVQRRLPEALKMRTMICRFDGKAVCGVVFSTLGDTALEIFMATSGKALEVQAAYALLWHQLQWFQERGIRLFDIGGIDPEGNPGGYRFKKGLSGRDLEYIGQFEVCANPLSRAATHAAERLRAAYRDARAPKVQAQSDRDAS